MGKLLLLAFPAPHNAGDIEMNSSPNMITVPGIMKFRLASVMCAAICQDGTACSLQQTGIQGYGR